MNEENLKEVTIKIFPEIGNSYKLIISINNNQEIEEQIDSWIDENLKFVQEWKLVL